MEPTRIELDLPVVIINQFGHLHLDNLKDINDVVGAFFGKGHVITIHMVVESTGETRGFCKYVSHTSYGDSICNFTLRSDGTCIRQDEHDKDTAKQLAAGAEEAE